MSTSRLLCSLQNRAKTLVLPIRSSPSAFYPFSFISFSLRQSIKHLACRAIWNSSQQNQDVYQPAHSYPKPSKIQWKKEFCNSVQLIGTVGLPIQFNRLSSEKVMASTRLAVRKSSTETSWVNLTFWDELAHVAHQHVEKGHQIYVCGRLESDTVEGEDGKQQTFYKVFVQQLNFVEKTSPAPVALYGGSSRATETVGKFENSSVTNRSSKQELWQQFFANPANWWDNRKNKKNPKSPDFKHKVNGEALWVEARYNPPWVKSQLKMLDSRISVQNQNDSGLF